MTYWSSRCGPLILNQPWEFGAVPEEWINPINDKVHRLVVPSEAVQEMFVISGVKENKITVIPNGIDPSVFHPFGPKLNLSMPRRVIFLWVGGLIPRKGLDILLEAYQQTFSRNDDVILILKIVGKNTVYPNEFPDLLKQMLDSPKAPLIQVITQDLSEMQMASLYRSATCLISPYRGEGFNMPVLEALACGALVATSDTNPTNEFVPKHIGFRIPGQRKYLFSNDKGPPSWYFEPNIDGLKMILEEITSLSPSEIEHRKKNGNRWAVEHFSWAKVWEKWEYLFASDSQHHIPVLEGESYHSVIWQGPIRNASGYAAESRLFLKALPQFRFIPRIIDQIEFGTEAITSAEEKYFSTLENIPVPYPLVTVQNVPAHNSSFHRQGLDVIRTTFETTHLPEVWKTILNHFAHILVPSKFNFETFSNSKIATDKIHIVPGPIDTRFYVPPETKEPHNTIRFISVFDWIDRKGWDILVTAWAKAFSSIDPVSLIIKTTTIANKDANPEKAVTDLLGRQNINLSQIAPIHIFNGKWTDQELRMFYQAGDIFVLPTRGEGWGRPILEAMSCGLPVIVTNWSGPSDFISGQNALPLNVRRITQIPNTTDMPVLHGHEWAEPDLDHLIELFRWAVDHVQELKSIGYKARETALQYDSVKVTEQLSKLLLLWM